ncbi:hypothetical protein ZIOFF_073607 [Zingiber officinale]|uniref:Uncharacterized protein n=1 Tax=Zingiber officinale TaxID=94328 RepID=A0A8J5ETT9_ZINOF|nr:hypothetical protein ZIOFF_073607 [Zingiber officinale]
MYIFKCHCTTINTLTPTLLFLWPSSLGIFLPNQSSEFYLMCTFAATAAKGISWRRQRLRLVLICLAFLCFASWVLFLLRGGAAAAVPLPVTLRRRLRVVMQDVTAASAANRESPATFDETLFLRPPASASWDSYSPPECPYPCLPPPTSVSICPPPPPPAASYPPPSPPVAGGATPGYYYPPHNYFPAPPPPNPVLPWFPWYYTSPPSASAASFVEQDAGVLIASLVMFALCLILF